MWVNFLCFTGIFLVKNLLIILPFDFLLFDEVWDPLELVLNDSILIGWSIGVLGASWMK
jgi:hypothetical protein